MAVFAFVGAATPGPVNIIATSSSANFGIKRTFPHVLGASLSYAAIVLFVGTGLNQVLLSNPKTTVYLQYLGAAWLLYMSYKIADSEPGQALANRQNMSLQKVPSLLQGALVQGLNPKAWLVSISGVSIFVTPNLPNNLYLFIFTGLSFVICMLGVGLWAVLGGLLSRFLATEQYQIAFNRAMGLLLSLTVLAMFM